MSAAVWLAVKMWLLHVNVRLQIPQNSFLSQLIQEESLTRWLEQPKKGKKKQPKETGTTGSDSNLAAANDISRLQQGLWHDFS